MNSEEYLLLRACYRLIYIPTTEEERLRAIAKTLKNTSHRNFYIWDFVDGYDDNNPNSNFALARKNCVKNS